MCAMLPGKVGRERSNGSAVMQVSQCVGCKTFPCVDVNKAVHVIPDVEVKPEDISIILISESAPADPGDYYYAKGAPAFQQTTVQAFNDAGANVAIIQDILDLGVYLTSAVKCGKTGYAIRTDTIKECALILEKEIALFTNVRAFLLMGDVAIKAFNTIAARAGEKRVIPAGSTYKLRGQEYTFRGKRVFPSYLQAGPSFNIEKSKRRMIAEDIAAALALVK
jgi:uracil-DNA glycosylase